MSEREHLAAVYRHFDGSGKLLYVGVSSNAAARLSQHKDHSSWFKEIRRVEIEHHESRAAALEAERAAIREEQPLHNVRLKLARSAVGPPIVSDDGPEASRFDLLARVVRLNPVYRLIHVAELLDLPQGSVRKLIAAGALGHVLLPPRRPSYRARIGNGPAAKTATTLTPSPPVIGVTGWQIIDYLESLQIEAARGTAA